MNLEGQLATGLKRGFHRAGAETQRGKIKDWIWGGSNRKHHPPPGDRTLSLSAPPRLRVEHSAVSWQHLGLARTLRFSKNQSSPVTIMSTMSTAASNPEITAELIQTRIAHINWFHQIDLGHGVVTPGDCNSRQK